MGGARQDDDGRCGYFEDDAVVSSVVSADLDSLFELELPDTLTADFSGLKPCRLPRRDMRLSFPAPLVLSRCCTPKTRAGRVSSGYSHVFTNR